MIENIFKKTKIIFEKQKGTEKYFPKRYPSDSMISWDNNMNKIIFFINANSIPNPVSFTEINEEKIYIIEAVKFNWKFKKNYKIGEIAKVFLDKSFLVKCNDGFILIKKWSSKKNFDIFKYEGKKCKFTKRKIHLKFILKKFKKKNPNKKISNYINV